MNAVFYMELCARCICHTYQPSFHHRARDKHASHVCGLVDGISACRPRVSAQLCVRRRRLAASAPPLPPRSLSAYIRGRAVIRHYNFSSNRGSPHKMRMGRQNDKRPSSKPPASSARPGPTAPGSSPRAAPPSRGRRTCAGHAMDV